MSEEAMNRAMSLLRAVWDESGTGTDIIARKADHGNHWNDVLRWVSEGENTYRGPGRYRHCSGEIYEVLGMADGGADDPRVAIVRHSSGEYYYEREEDFKEPVGGKRRYEYLGPLEDNVTAPTPAQVERASQAMAQLSQGMITEAKVYAFDVGDRAVVRTILNAAALDNTDNATAPVKIQVVSAGQGWVVLRLWNGEKVRLDTGDTFEVPVVVLS